MALKLKRDLICFDLETTGLDVNSDRIVELAVVKIKADGTRETRTRRLNPERPIAEAATAVHGISNEDVAHEPTFGQIAMSLHGYFEHCDLTGFNVERFDLPLLTKEFERVGIKFPGEGTRVIDSWRIFLAKEPRDLTAAFRYYCGKTLEDAHSAEADAVAAADVLLAQIERYDDLPGTIEELDVFCHPTQPDWIDGEGKIIWSEEAAVLNFGKHKGKALKELAQDMPDYLRWICNADFPKDVVSLCRDALDGIFPEKKNEQASAA